MKLSWCPDVIAEINLRKLGVVFGVEKIAFSRIDFKESQVNNARIGEPIIKELVSDYRQGMLNGDAFPRPVVHDGKSGWIVLSGNQRCAAIAELIKEGKLPKSPQIEVYKLEGCDRLLREIIARAFNCYHGGRNAQNERLQHAIQAVRNLGMRPAEAARVFMVDPANITRHIRAEKQRTELMRAGVDASRLPTITLDHLSKLPFDQNASRQVATLVSQHDVPSDRVKQVVDGIKRLKTQQSRTAKVKEFERELADQVRATSKPKPTSSPSKVPSRPRRDRVLRMCEQLVHFLEHGNDGDSFTTLDQLQFSGNTDTARLKTLVGRLALRWSVLEV